MVVAPGASVEMGQVGAVVSFESTTATPVRVMLPPVSVCVPPAVISATDPAPPDSALDAGDFPLDTTKH